VCDVRHRELRRQQFDSHGRASGYLLAACAQKLSKTCMLKYCSFNCSGHSVAKRPCLFDVSGVVARSIGC
jgi:hypothetical protein